jgi:glycosyltransferase involved in cell wall biosynthesis
VPSAEVADLLRAHDVYIAASRDDPCSNALLEALACGLPAAFLRSGGHPELVGEGGLGFAAAEEIPAVLVQLRDELDERRTRIRVPSLADVADRYLTALHP